MRLYDCFDGNKYLVGYGIDQIDAYEDSFKLHLEEFQTHLKGKKAFLSFLDERHFLDHIGVRIGNGMYEIEGGSEEIGDDFVTTVNTVAYVEDSSIGTIDMRAEAYFLTMKEWGLKNDIDLSEQQFEVLFNKNFTINSQKYEIGRLRQQLDCTKDQHQRSIKIQVQNRQYDQYEFARMLDLLRKTTEEPIFIGPILFYGDNIVAITTYEGIDLPEGLYRSYLDVANNFKKNIFEVSLSLKMPYARMPRRKLTDDIWKQAWERYRSTIRLTYIFHFKRYEPDGDWFMRLARKRLDSPVSIT